MQNFNYCHLASAMCCPKTWKFENGLPIHDSCCEICDTWLDESNIRNEILSYLKNNVCKITFKKVDGSIRTMTVTLVPYLVPTQEKETTRKTSIETIRCFELDLKEWRSFRIDSLIEFTFL